jgi:SET family sugar efflux transporter-like MFS transporter
MSKIAGNRFSSAFIGLAVLLLGTSDAMVGSYLVLFLADARGLAPPQIAVATAAPAIGGIVIGTVLGRSFDRRPSRWYVVVLVTVGALGMALLSHVRSFPLLLVIAAAALGAAGAAVPLLFALGRVVLGAGAGGRRSAPLLRSVWSLSWALGPLLGAVVLARNGYTVLLLTGAAVLLLAAPSVLGAPAPGSAEQRADETPAATAPRSAVVVLVVAVTLFFTAMFTGSIALPLYVTRTLHEPDSSVGLLFSACAAVEVVVAIGLAVLPDRLNQTVLITASMVVFTVSFLLVILATSMTLLLVAQIGRGIGIAVVGAAGLRYFQDLLPGAPGRATALFSNASVAGSPVSGIVAGVAIQAYGYSGTLLLCAAVALASAFVFVTGATRAVRTPSPAGTPR